MMLLQICLDSLSGKFQEVSLDMFSFECALDVPDQVDVVCHNGEAVHFHPAISHKEFETIKNNLFILILFSKVFPLQDGGGKELEIIHLFHEVRQMRLKVVKCFTAQFVGAAAPSSRAEHQQRRKAL